MKATRGSPGPDLRAGLRAIAFAAALLAAGCATPPEDPVARAAFDEAADPIEPFNRFMFDVNLAFDDAVFKPVATAYRDVVPEPVRDALRNLLRNLRSPLIFANDILQGEPRRAGVTLQRFLVNSVVGFAGLVDVADLAIGLKFHDEDFGQTLGVWGAGEGLYLFLPVLGPSSARDLTGIVVDGLIDPVSYAFAYFDIGYGPPARSVLTALDARSRAIDSLDDVRKTSIDFYAALRSLYRQKREDEILNGRAPPGGRRSPTLENPAIEEGGEEKLPPRGVAPVLPVISQSLPKVGAMAGMAPEGAGAAPPQRGRVDWSAWAPALVFNPPSLSASSASEAAASARPGAGVQLASYQPTPTPAPPPIAPPRPAPAQAAAPTPATTIPFRDGSAELGANDRALLRQVAQQAQQQGASLRVVGHAADSAPGLDELGRRLHNFDLSWARAIAAAEELERAGLPAQRIVMEANDEPAPSQSAAGPGSRRVSVYLQ